MNTKKFPARLDVLHQILRWIQNTVEILGFEKSDLRKIELASEEALVNIIQHAYKGKQAGFIEVTVKKQNGFELILKDQGPYFNPLLEKVEVSLDVPLEKRLEGGLGIFMMKKYMDHIHYQREGSTNILTLIKNLPSY